MLGDSQYGGRDANVEFSTARAAIVPRCFEVQSDEGVRVCFINEVGGAAWRFATHQTRDIIFTVVWYSFSFSSSCARKFVTSCAFVAVMFWATSVEPRDRPVGKFPEG